MGIVGLVVVDQLTKAMVTSSLRLHETVAVIPGLLNLTYVRNTGAAFGVLNAVEFPFKPLIVTLLALAALARSRPTRCIRRRTPGSDDLA